MAKILVVNDDPALLAVLCELLREQGHRAIPGGPSDRALERLPYVKPDLVITDLLDPPVGGLEVIRLAKQYRPDLPVLVESGFGDAEHVLEAAWMGADRYLPLPFNIEEFNGIVDQTLADPVTAPELTVLEWAGRYWRGGDRVLLERLNGITRRARGPWTALHTAAVWGHAEQAELLLEAGAEVNAPAQLGMTALHWAVRNGHRRVAELLLEWGADPMLPDAFGRRPLVAKRAE